MRKNTKLDPSLLIRKTPLLIFFFTGIVLTQSSLLFPQNQGRFQKVAGWPLTMYETRYRIERDIEPTGTIIHRTVQDDSQLMWGRLVLNIILWTFILYGTWWMYQKVYHTSSSQAVA